MSATPIPCVPLLQNGQKTTLIGTFYAYDTTCINMLMLGEWHYCYERLQDIKTNTPRSDDLSEVHSRFGGRVRFSCCPWCYNDKLNKHPSNGSINTQQPDARLCWPVWKRSTNSIYSSTLSRAVRGVSQSSRNLFTRRLLRNRRQHTPAERYTTPSRSANKNRTNGYGIGAKNFRPRDDLSTWWLMFARGPLLERRRTNRQMNGQNYELAKKSVTRLERERSQQRCKQYGTSIIPTHSRILWKGKAIMTR